MCSADGCNVCHSAYARKNRCKRHPEQALKSSATLNSTPCPVEYCHVWPTKKEDKRYWLYCHKATAPTAYDNTAALSLHNHPLPITVAGGELAQAKELRPSTRVRENILRAARENPNLTARGLSQGMGQSFMPAMASPSIDDRAIYRLKERACAETVGT